MSTPILSTESKPNVHFQISLQRFSVDPNKTTADRVKEFMLNPTNYKKAIAEGAFLYLVTRFSDAEIAKIVVLSSAMDLASHVVHPEKNSSTKSFFTTICAGLAAQGMWLPLAFQSFVRL